jgi:hypothetical protein
MELGQPKYRCEAVMSYPSEGFRNRTVRERMSPATQPAQDAAPFKRIPVSFAGWRDLQRKIVNIRSRLPANWLARTGLPSDMGLQ